VDDIAAQFNNRLNNVEMEQRVHDVYFSMLSQATGINLPTKEEVIEALIQQDKEEAEAKQAEVSSANVEEAVAKAVVPVFEKMVEMFGSLMGKGTVTIDDISKKTEEKEEMFYEPKEEEKTQAKKEETSEPVNKDNKSKKKEQKKEEPKKEETSEAPKGKGRRRVKRGASLVGSDNE
jgi:Mg-chelatase subunit ChlI